MSSRGSSNNGGGVGGVVMIPTGSRKMVESLKEIVRNYPESEIYAALKECSMDPNEAVDRLLSQDPFHEVKSKRDKRKENKDTTESRPRGASSSNRGADRYAGRPGSESALHGKSTYAYKENGFTATKSTRSAGSTTNMQLPTFSDAVGTESKKLVAAAVDGVSTAKQHSSGYQPAWVGVPGQLSMADIVKMGKPHSKAPNGTSESWQNVNASHIHVQGPSSGALDHNLQFSDDHTSKVSEVYLEAGVSPAQHDSTNHEWPLIEQPSAASNPSISDPPSSQLHPDSSHTAFDRTNQLPQSDEVQEAEDHGIDSVGAVPVVSGSLPNRKLLEDNSGGASSLYDSELDRYQPRNHGFDSEDVEDTDASVSLAAVNLQQLSIQEEQGQPPERDVPAVVIPDHLQVQAADCSHLSFGSFGSGISATFSGALASAPVETDVEEASKDADTPLVGHLTNGSSEYYADEDLRNTQDGILFHRTGAISGNYESPSDSQPDSLKVEHPEVAHGNQYSFPSSAPGYTYENAQQLNVAFSQSQTSSQTQNLAPFSNVMGYTNSLPSNLLTANVHAGRESDLSYSPFSTQAMPTKYGNLVSSVGSSISMPEALKTVGFSSTQPTQQTLTGTNVATGPALPQHLAVHPYSQPTLPLGPFANIISYPFLPQSYTYMPPGFQQPFAGNSTYQQSLAAVLPQYKSSVSVSSLPHSAGVASGYGAFGNTGTIPGSFPLNPSAAPSTSLDIDDGLSSQYKDGSHLMSIQQGENSGMWLHGQGSRTMSAVPANTYYNIQGQNQQPNGYRQVQQPSQNYGSLGYPNFYHSQTGISVDHHQQNPRDGSLGGVQVQPKPSQQLWQNGY